MSGKSLTYTELRPSLKSGDGVMFIGTGIVSNAIGFFQMLTFALHPSNWKKGFIKKLLTKRFTHIGTVVVSKGRVMIFESTKLFNGKDGVQLNAFSERVQSYKGRIAIRHLECKRDIHFYNVLHRFIVNTLDIKYEKDVVELIGAISILAHALSGHQEDLSTIFCSELKSALFKLWHFLAESIPSNKYSPEDYNEGGEVDIQLRYSEKEVSQSKLVWVK